MCEHLNQSNEDSHVCALLLAYLQNLHIIRREPSSDSIYLSFPPPAVQWSQELDYFSHLEFERLAMFPAEGVQTSAVNSCHCLKGKASSRLKELWSGSVTLSWWCFHFQCRFVECSPAFIMHLESRREERFLWFSPTEDLQSHFWVVQNLRFFLCLGRIMTFHGSPQHTHTLSRSLSLSLTHTHTHTNTRTHNARKRL